MTLQGSYIEDIEAWSYRCRFCPETFRYKKDLRRHEQTHESKPKKKGLVLST